MRHAKCNGQAARRPHPVASDQREGQRLEHDRPLAEEQARPLRAEPDEPQLRADRPRK